MWLCARRLRQYEFIYGATHTGTGGDAVARAVGRELELRPNQSALEIASGLGGSAFLIAQARALRSLTLPDTSSHPLPLPALIHYFRNFRI